MKTTGELLRDLVAAHVRSNDTQFRESVELLIKEERKKNHHVLASDLERLLLNGGGGYLQDVGVLSPYRRYSADVPVDTERELPLVQVLEPGRREETVILSDHLRHRLDRVVAEIRQTELLQSYGLRPSSRLLFYGAPGCGKTAEAESLALKLGLPLFVVRFDAVVSSYLGETAANLGKLFSWASRRPGVLLFDEFDAIGRSRSDEQEHGELKRVVNSFLQMLDSFRPLGLVIAATNHEQILDSAVWRRFDEVLEFELPSKQQIVDLLELNLRAIPHEVMDLDVLADEMAGFSHADVERTCMLAAKAMVLSDGGELTQAWIADEIATQRRRLHAGGSR